MTDIPQNDQIDTPAEEIIRFSTEPGAPGEARVTASGEIDVHTAPLLLAEVRRVVEGGAPSVVLDLADVGFMDSSGLRALITLREQALAAGGELRITAASRSVQRVIEVTGLSEFLGVPGEAGS